jgi:hypothetical protein
MALRRTDRSPIRLYIAVTIAATGGQWRCSALCQGREPKAKKRTSSTYVYFCATKLDKFIVCMTVCLSGSLSGSSSAVSGSGNHPQRNQSMYRELHYIVVWKTPADKVSPTRMAMGLALYFDSVVTHIKRRCYCTCGT